MSVSHGKLLLLAVVLSLGEVSCIVSKLSDKPEDNDIKKPDNAVEQSIKRDYSFEETGYGHGGGYGLSAHSNYGFAEGHEGYGAVEGGKHYIHYPDHHHHHHEDHHKHYDLGYHKALAIKSLLVPLAGVALLGAAAAFVSNPILLQLGVISGSSLGRRKREVTPGPTREDRLRDITLLRRFMGQIPEQKIQFQEKKMVADYLSCSGITKTNLCLERLACELHSSEGSKMAVEANVFSIALNEILDNEFVPEEVRRRLEKAIDSGRREEGCGAFQCTTFDPFTE